MNNKQVQLVYNNDTTYQTYSLELKEINLRLGKILQQQNKLIESMHNLRKNTLPYPNHKHLLTLKDYKKIRLIHRFLRDTPTILHLADRSTFKPKDMLEDIIISIHYWEYPIDFLVLQPKYQSNGYPLILGRPWLATKNAYNGCTTCNMNIVTNLMRNI
jgi:hypothetical protein